jgi:hypothetical protein
VSARRERPARSTNLGSRTEVAVKFEYWKVSDRQIVEKTGKDLAHWSSVLASFNARAKKSNDVVAHLEGEHGVPRYWARTLTTWFRKTVK